MRHGLTCRDVSPDSFRGGLPELTFKHECLSCDNDTLLSLPRCSSISSSADSPSRLPARMFFIRTDCHSAFPDFTQVQRMHHEQCAIGLSVELTFINRALLLVILNNILRIIFRYSQPLCTTPDQVTAHRSSSPQRTQDPPVNMKDYDVAFCLVCLMLLALLVIVSTFIIKMAHIMQDHETVRSRDWMKH